LNLVFSKVQGQKGAGGGDSGARTYFGIHGWSGTHETFAPLVGELPPDVSFVTVDLPGHGRSGWSGDLDLDLLAGMLSAEMGRIEARRFTLVGNCSGALLGLAALEAEPALISRVERMVLIDPFAYAPWYFRIFVTPPIGRYAYYSTFANPLGRWLANQSLRGHRQDDTDLTHSFRHLDHAVSYRYLEILTGISSIDRWKGIGIETDLVYGARTFGAIRRSVGMWQAIWPHARVHELKAAGHLPILEATDDLRRILFG
jgi:pimeloyl-ACP methyl ester carboxylesterase